MKKSETKKMNKTQKMAKWALDHGYENIATIVKQVYNTQYYNINTCKSIIEQGHIVGASGCSFPIGTISNQIDWKKTITRVDCNYQMTHNK